MIRQRAATPVNVPLINKSTRHQKITGDFGEHLTLYLLSKYGFECAKVDHTGIDIIARNPHTQEVMGISVTMRSREVKNASKSVGRNSGHVEKLKSACEAFKCTPYFSFVIDRDEKMSVFIVALETFLKFTPNGRSVLNWKMTPAAIEMYSKHKKIYRWESNHKVESWWPASENTGRAVSTAGRAPRTVRG